jgi:hypothetical protein
MGNVISVRLNDMEKEMLSEVSTMYGCGVSSLIKKLVFEKLEDDYDMQIIKDYENKKAAGKIKTRPIDKLWAELEL